VLGHAPPQDEANPSQNSKANDGTARYVPAGLEQEQDDRENHDREAKARPDARKIAPPFEQLVQPIETKMVRRQGIGQAGHQPQTRVNADVAKTVTDGPLIGDGERPRQRALP